MSYLLEMNLVANSLPGEILRVGATTGGGLRRSRELASVGVVCSLLLVALNAASFAPAAFGQGQAGAATQGQNSSAANSSAKPQSASAQTSGQYSAQTSTQTSTLGAAHKPVDASAQSEPKMEDQSAPAAESLGDAARRARAQKAQAAKPKVFTEDSVTTLSGHGVSVVGDGNGGGGGTSYSGNAESGGGGGARGTAGSQESYWRGRANEIRGQMAACDQKISEIQDEIAKHGAASEDPMSGAQIKQVEKQKDGLQSQLEALEEEGRKAGADSGWFR